MDRRMMIVALAAILAAAAAVWFTANASIERTRLQAGATVAKAQEHTKRADGRHELLDMFGRLKRIPE